MKERPILFQGAMVRALLAGTKTQTRRILKPQPFQLPLTVGEGGTGWHWTTPKAALARWTTERGFAAELARFSPHGVPGDGLWVREAHYVVGEFDQVFYRADGSNSLGDGLQWTGKWKPGIHMFRRHSRILLEVTAVRVERLQDISEADALAEGINPLLAAPERMYANLWDSINGPGSWDANPWVWVVEFRMSKRGNMELPL
jgi:hypothetical protein